MFRELPTPARDKAALDRFDADCHERMRRERHVVAAAQRQGFPRRLVELHGRCFWTPQGEAAWRQDAGNWSTEQLDAVAHALGGR